MVKGLTRHVCLTAVKVFKSRLIETNTPLGKRGAKGVSMGEGLLMHIKVGQNVFGEVGSLSPKSGMLEK